MSAHGVPRDGHFATIQLLEVVEQQLRKLLRQVRLHLVVLGPGCLGGVDVEGGGAAKVVGVVFAGEVGPAGGCVWVEEGEVEGRGVGVEKALLGDVVGRAGQAGEVD